jgi:hypothetical protein
MCSNGLLMAYIMCAIHVTVLKLANMHAHILIYDCADVPILFRMSATTLKYGEDIELLVRFMRICPLKVWV